MKKIYVVTVDTDDYDDGGALALENIKAYATTMVEAGVAEDAPEPEPEEPKTSSYSVMLQELWCSSVEVTATSAEEAYDLVREGLGVEYPSETSEFVEYLDHYSVYNNDTETLEIDR